MFILKKSHYVLISSVLLQANIPSFCAIIVRGDSQALNQSFIHPIHNYVQGLGVFYVGASESGAKDFALAGCGSTAESFTPLAPEKVSLDGIKEQKNPLFNAQIDLMALMYEINQFIPGNQISNRIAAVIHDAPSKIYLIDSISRDNIELVSSQTINDSGAQSTHNIRQMVSDNNTAIFAAVNDHNFNTFGTGNSGIAILSYCKTKTEGAQTEQTSLIQTPTQYITPGAIQSGNAAQLNNQSPVLRINNPTAVTMLDNAVHLNWSTRTPCLYTALHVNAQGTASDGCQAIVIGKWIQRLVGYVEQNNEGDNDDKKSAKKIEVVEHSFILHGLTVPTAFVAGENNIVGGIGSDITVSVHQTRSIETTTGLDYLVIVGGVGTQSQTGRQVYALPIVKLNGMLAKKGSLPETFYYRSSNRIFDRGFVRTAINPGDLYTANDSEVQVGHGPMTEGDITSLIVCNDAVYAIISPDTGHTTGIFSSQALFDEFGRIKEWTEWKRVTTRPDELIFAAILDAYTGNLTMITQQPAVNPHTVLRTTWGNGDLTGNAKLVALLTSSFPTEKGGMQGLFDLQQGTQGLNNIGLVVATGNNTVALAQTSVQNLGIIQPLLGDQLAHNPESFDNGTIDHAIAPDCNAITIQAGELSSLGSIKAAAITRYKDAGYLFVGGTNGLAVLINDQGYSWNALIGLGNNLSGLTTGSYFKSIGTYRFIRKIMCDDIHGQVYIVTDATFDRIDINASNFMTGELQITRLAAAGQFPLEINDTIYDAVISNSFSLIGTSKGLFKNGPYVDIRIAANVQQVNWQHVTLPEGLCTAQQIFCITRSMREQDLTIGSGGMIYVLDTDSGKHKAIAHRFTINTQSNDPQYPYLLQPLHDIFIKDIPSYFVQFDGYRNWIYTDGALFFQERDRTECNDPLLTLLYVRSGLRFGGTSLDIVSKLLHNTSIIQPIVRSSGSGSWLLAQNNALIVNE